MPNNIYSPTITVARNKAGLDSGDEFDVLVSPSRSGVVSFSYDTFKTLFTIRCLDPDGRIMRKLGQWDISDWSSRYLSGESKRGLASGASVWDQKLAIRIEDGLNPPAVAVSYLVGLTNFVDDREQHVVELRFNAEPFQMDRNSSTAIGGDYLGSSKRFNDGQVPVGTFEKTGGDFGTSVEFKVDFDRLVLGIEDLMAEPVRTENHEAIVILGDNTTERLKFFYDRGPTPDSPLQSFDRFLTDKLLFNFVERAEGPQQGSLYLMDCDTKVDPDEELDAKIDRSGRGIQYAVQRLQQIATSVGSIDIYDAVTLTDPKFVELYRDAFEGAFPEFNVNGSAGSITIIGDYRLISSLSSKEAALGVASKGGKAISKIADKISDLYDQAFTTASEQSLAVVFDEGFVLPFRANTEDSNVISITHTQNHAVALSMIKDNMPLKTMLAGEEPLFEGDVKKLVKQFLTLNMLKLPNMEKLDKKLAEMGYGERESDAIIDRFVEQLEKYIDIKPDDQFSQAGLLSYLQYIHSRQILGGNKLIVRTPPQFNLTGQHFLKLAATVTHTLNKTTITDKRDPVTGENPYSFLNGVYQVLNIKHAATDQNAYSEFTLVQRPHESNQEVPVVEPDERPAADVQMRDITRNDLGIIETPATRLDARLRDAGFEAPGDKYLQYFIDPPQGTYRDDK